VLRRPAPARPPPKPESLRGAVPLCAIACALALLGLAGSGPRPPGGDPDALSPEVGRFLVATDQVRGSIFEESVVFLVEAGHEGALGVIVNRPTEISLDRVVDGVRGGAGLVHLGGPVALGSVMVLLRADAPLEKAVRVVEDVFVTVDPALLVERAERDDAATRLRAYAGYAGWAPGQLDAEIVRGDWIVVAAPTATIFEEDSAGLWQKLFRRYHRLMARAPAGRGRARDFAPLPPAARVLRATASLRQIRIRCQAPVRKACARGTGGAASAIAASLARRRAER